MAVLTAITPVTPAPSGVTVPEYSDTTAAAAIVLTAATDIAISNNGQVYLHVRRTGTSASTMTIVTHKAIEGLDVEDRAVALPTTSGEVREFGPFDPDIYNDENGFMTLRFSSVSDIELSVVRRG